MQHFEKTTVHGGLKATKAAALLMVACTVLTACSPSALHSKKATAPENQKPSALGSAQASVQAQAKNQALRIIVKFRYVVPFRDEVFLRDLGQKTNTRITYLTSVSPDVHVYSVEPQRGQSRADIFQALASNPAVLYAEADVAVKPS